MGLLARALSDELHTYWTAIELAPAFTELRAPEVGMVMVRGRAGGSGSPFNVGEMTVTRCAIQLETGYVGHAYIAGRRPRHARISAVIDALMLEGTRRAEIEARVLDPLARNEADRARASQTRADATRVDFFTMVRSEA